MRRNQRRSAVFAFFHKTIFYYNKNLSHSLPNFKQFLYNEGMMQSRTIFVDAKASSITTTNKSVFLQDGKDRKKDTNEKIDTDEIENRTVPRVLLKVHEELVKEEIKSQIETDKKLDEVLARSQKIIYRTSAFFPFDLFPDELVVDAEKVDIINRQFFWTKQVHSVQLNNIAEVSVETSIFFATLRLVEKGVMDYQMSTIRFLKKKDAYKAKQVIQGLIVATKENINLTAFPTDDLRRRLEIIGTTQNISEIND